MSDTLFSWEVSVKDWPGSGGIINARTRGKAKAEYYLTLSDAWPGIPFTAVRCRKIGVCGGSSEDFIRCAESRGLLDLRVGQRVEILDGLGTGVVTGHDDAARFIVLFDDDSGRHAGQKVSVHPGDFTRINHRKVEPVPPLNPTNPTPWRGVTPVKNR